MNTTIQVRIDSKLKKEVLKIFKSLGLDLSSAVKLFLIQVVRHNGIPFEISNVEIAKFKVDKTRKTN